MLLAMPYVWSYALRTHNAVSTTRPKASASIRCVAAKPNTLKSKHQSSGGSYMEAAAGCSSLTSFS